MLYFYSKGVGCVKKSFIKASAVLFVLLFLCGCGKKEEKPTETTQNYITTEPATAVVNNFHTEEMIFSAPETNMTVSQAPQTVTTSETPSQTQPAQQQQTVTPPSTQAPTEQTPTETTEKVYKKTGEMAFSESSDNKFIKSVADKYGLDTKNLVVFYTVPENNGNMVLEFDGTTDSNGKLIRNKDTLVAIYTIDKDLNSKRASKNSSLNEYSYGEMMVMYMTTTKYIMPEFEAELNG